MPTQHPDFRNGERTQRQISSTWSYMKLIHLKRTELEILKRLNLIQKEYQVEEHWPQRRLMRKWKKSAYPVSLGAGERVYREVSINFWKHSTFRFVCCQSFERLPNAAGRTFATACWLVPFLVVWGAAPVKVSSYWPATASSKPHVVDFALIEC